MVLIPWYFGAVYFTMVLIPINSIATAYLVPFPINGDKVENRKIIQPRYILRPR